MLLRSATLALIAAASIAAPLTAADTPTFPAPAPHKAHDLELYQMKSLNLQRPYDLPGITSIRGKATGAFHLERIAGRDWLIDPKGQGYLAIGSQVTPGMWPLLSSTYAAPGTPAHKRNTADKLRQWTRMLNRYGSVPEWLAGARAEATAMGSTIDVMWSMDQLTGYFPMIRGLPMSYTFYDWQQYDDNPVMLAKDGGQNRVDPFHPAWEAQCDEVARQQVAAFKGSPWIIGFTIDNECRWGDRYSIGATAWKYGGDKPAKQELARQAQKTFGTIEAFNSAFASDYESFEAFRSDNSGKARTPTGPEGFAFLEAFSISFYDRFYGVAAAAIRRHAPNALVLGAREIGVRYQEQQNPGLWKVIGTHCDAVSFNMYGNWDPKRGPDQALVNTWASLAKLSGKPLINTEWSVLSRDSGFTRYPHQVQIVETQAERADAYQGWVEAFFAQPWAVGSHWFMGTDEWKTDVDGKPVAWANWGAYKEDLSPYTELVERIATVNPTLADIHAGKREPTKPIWAKEGQRPWKPALPTTAVPRAEPNAPIVAGDWRVIPMGGNDGANRVAVEWKGTRLGDFFPYTAQNRYDDGMRWSWPSQCRVVNVVSDARYTVVELEFGTPTDVPADAGGGEPPKAGAWTGGGWKCGYQLWIPTSGDFIASRHLWTENASDRAWILPSVSHSLSPAIGGSFANNRLGLWEQRAEWEATWVNDKLGIGLTSQTPSGRIHLVPWMMGETPKSDYNEAMQLNRLIKPGERWTNLDSPPCFHSGFSYTTGGAYPYAEIRAVTDRILKTY